MKPIVYKPLTCNSDISHPGKLVVSDYVRYGHVGWTEVDSSMRCPHSIEGEGADEGGGCGDSVPCDGVVSIVRSDDVIVYV